MTKRGPTSCGCEEQRDKRLRDEVGSGLVEVWQPGSLTERHRGQAGRGAEPGGEGRGRRTAAKVDRFASDAASAVSRKLAAESSRVNPPRSLGNN